jgi:hypothetical protein
MKVPSMITEFIEKQIYMKRSKHPSMVVLIFFFFKDKFIILLYLKKDQKTLLASFKVSKLENN